MMYGVYTCFSSMACWRALQPFGAYLPIERTKRFDGRVLCRAAIPGYMFLPMELPERSRELRAAFDRYHLGMLTDIFEKPRTVELYELHRMQKVLNDEFENKPVPKDFWSRYSFKPGELVSFRNDSILSGMTAEFIRYKGSNRGRVFLNGRHIDVSLAVLASAK